MGCILKIYLYKNKKVFSKDFNVYIKYFWKESANIHRAAAREFPFIIHLSISLLPKNPMEISSTSNLCIHVMLLAFHYILFDSILVVYPFCNRWMETEIVAVNFLCISKMPSISTTLPALRRSQITISFHPSNFQ